MKTFLFTKRISCNISINSNNIYSRFLSDSFNSKDNSNIQEQVEHNKDWDTSQNNPSKININWMMKDLNMILVKLLMMKS